jgi:hypothetical protein
MWKNICHTDCVSDGWTIEVRNDFGAVLFLKLIGSVVQGPEEVQKP